MAATAALRQGSKPSSADADGCGCWKRGTSAKGLTEAHLYCRCWRPLCCLRCHQQLPPPRLRRSRARSPPSRARTAATLLAARHAAAVGAAAAAVAAAGASQGATEAAQDPGRWQWVRLRSGVRDSTESQSRCRRPRAGSAAASWGAGVPQLPCTAKTAQEALSSCAVATQRMFHDRSKYQAMLTLPVRYRSKSLTSPSQQLTAKLQPQCWHSVLRVQACCARSHMARCCAPARVWLPSPPGRSGSLRGRVGGGPSTSACRRCCCRTPHGCCCCCCVGCCCRSRRLLQSSGCVAAAVAGACRFTCCNSAASSCLQYQIKLV